MDKDPALDLLFISVFILFSAFWQHSPAAAQLFNVGVVLDNSTLVGKLSRTSIYLAIDDFYTAHPNYTTRLVLKERDYEEDVVDAGSQAMDLLKNEKVQAILGAFTSSQAEFVLNLANKTHVPIVSFSATSPSLSPSRFPYFIRSATNDSAQVGCIAAIVDLFGWRQVVPIYEDTTDGVGILPYLVDAFNGVDTRIPYRSVIQSNASDDQIREELYKLKTMSTRVFVVHVSSALASRVFHHANDVGMMEEGYAWVITDGVTNLLGSIDPSVVESSMQGVLGVRPYLTRSSQLANFTVRWRAKFRQNNPTIEAAEPSFFSLWAYDSIWALAMAAEMVKNPGPDPDLIQSGNRFTELGWFWVSHTGPKLLAAMMESRFQGLSGDFHLVNGQLQSSVFQIVNVKGKGEREVAFWTPTQGITKKLSDKVHSIGNATQRKPSPVDVGPIIWPGEARAVPKGWDVPTGNKKLRVAVPVKNAFFEFVKVETDPTTNRKLFSGYCIDVFDAVVKKLPYAVAYEYVPFENKTSGGSAGTYDQLVQEVSTQEVDAVVGDVTTLANRSKGVDFSLPFAESGWTMLVRLKKKEINPGSALANSWSLGVWLVTGVFFIYIGTIIWFIERRVDPLFKEFPLLIKALSMIFYFAFSVISNGENVTRNSSRFVLLVSVVILLILQSSLTANWTSILTSQQLEPTVIYIDELLRNGDNVGYQKGSFIRDRLISLGFDTDKIVSYESPDQYADALTKGSRNGGVSAIFDETPYIKVFLSNPKYCSKYTTSGPTYATNGFGFVFRKGSPLVSDISRAILSVKEGAEMKEIEEKIFREQVTCIDKDSSFHGLTLSNAKWLFFTGGISSSLALLVHVVVYFMRNGGGGVTNCREWFNSYTGAGDPNPYHRHLEDADITGELGRLREQLNVLITSMNGEWRRRNDTENSNQQNEIGAREASGDSPRSS